MATTERLTVSVVTPQRQVAKGEYREVRAPSVLGEVGILPKHTPLLADLQAGVVELVTADTGITERIAVSDGFIEVDRDRVTVLAETAEKPEEIDVERAKRALAESEALMKKLPALDPGYVEARARAERARVRLAVASGRAS